MAEESSLKVRLALLRLSLLRTAMVGRIGVLSSVNSFRFPTALLAVPHAAIFIVVVDEF